MRVFPHFGKRKKASYAGHAVDVGNEHGLIVCQETRIEVRELLVSLFGGLHVEGDEDGPRARLELIFGIVLVPGVECRKRIARFEKRCTGGAVAQDHRGEQGQGR